MWDSKSIKMPDTDYHPNYFDDPCQACGTHSDKADGHRLTVKNLIGFIFRAMNVGLTQNVDSHCNSTSNGLSRSSSSDTAT
jgi:hypothetical protein